MREAQFLNILLNVDEQTRVNIGHQMLEKDSVRYSKISGFLQECTFKGADCLEDKYWMLVNSAIHGNCFIFNGAGNKVRKNIFFKKSQAMKHSRQMTNIQGQLPSQALPIV